MALPFRAISFQPSELLSMDKLNQLASNVNWIEANTPRVFYNAAHVRRKENIGIMCGKVYFAPDNADRASARVDFANFFSNNTLPIIATSLVTAAQTKVFHVINGIGQIQPDNRGFNVDIEVAATLEKNDKIKTTHVHWIAMGY